MKLSIPVLAFLGLIFILFIFLLKSYKDFGITWDESDVYNRAKSYVACARHGSGCDFFTSHDMAKGAFYGHLYGAGLYLVNKDMSFDLFHLYNGFAFLTFIVVCFLFCTFFLKDAWLGLIYTAALILCLPFSGHALTNPKDMPFAYAYSVMLFLLIYYLKLKKHTLIFSVLLGMYWSIVVNFRVAGLTIFPLWLLVVFSKMTFANVSVKKLMVEVIVTIVFLLIGMIISFPLLQNNFLSNLFALLSSSKSFDWNGDVLFAGKIFPASQLPFYYIPTLYLVMTPFFILWGVIIFLVKGLQHKNYTYGFIAISVAYNFVLYLLLKPLVYDGLRHYLFLYPPIVFLAAVSIKWMGTHSKLMTIITFVLVIKLIIQNYALYPYYYIYFNEFVGGLPGAYTRYETDYWGMSFRESYHKLSSIIGKNTPAKIYTCGHPTQSYMYFSPAHKFESDVEKADYFLCYTRFNQDKKLPASKDVAIVSRLGVPLNYVKQK